MIQYVTTKIVSAWPEARQDEPGYGVQYADGYTSWCPKEKFEQSSLALGDVSHMSYDGQMLTGELARVLHQIDNIAFVLAEKQAQHLLGERFERLQIQLEALKTYARCLRATVHEIPQWTATV